MEVTRVIIVVGLLLLLAFMMLGHNRYDENTTLVFDEKIEPTVMRSNPTREVRVAIKEIVPKVIQEKPQYDIEIVEDEAKALARMAWGEARGCSTVEIAATMWTVLNRVDAYDGSVIKVISAPQQFRGYSKKHPVTDDLYNLAVDVLTRWQKEKQGATTEEVGRVLPKEYLYFHGDGESNYFRITYKYNGEYWDWSLPNPYEESGE